METFAGVVSAYLGAVLAAGAALAVGAAGWAVYAAFRGRREMRMWEGRFRALDGQRRRSRGGRR